MQFQLQKYSSVDSTNAVAHRMAEQGAEEGIVVVADRQTGGHGRMQRVWSSPVGGLWFSLILRPQIDPRYVAQITLLAGVAVAKTLRNLYQTDEIRIKWPNDLLLEDKKVTGILAEMQLTENQDVDYVIVGIGVNVDPPMDDMPEEVKAKAESLNRSLDKFYSCETVLDAILKEFSKTYQMWQQDGNEAVLSLWKEMNCTLGKRVTVLDEDREVFSGKAVALDAEGALLVQNEAGREASFNFGEISIQYGK